MNPPHPDHELLSAALDGEGDPDTIAHLGSCDTCLAHLDTLDRVRQQIGAVPAAPPGLTDRAVAAATAAWRTEQEPTAATTLVPGRSATDGRKADRPLDDDIVPLRRRPGAPPKASEPRRPAWILGAVAALVAALLAVPVLLRDDGGSGEQTASAPTDEAVEQASALDAGAVDGGELGSLSDELTLREALVRGVPGAAEATAGRAAPTAGDTMAAPAAEASPSASAAITTTAPALNARQDSGAAAVGTDVACQADVREELGERVGPLLYTARLRWQGTDAVVLAYRLADASAPGPDHFALVMALDDCRVLSSQGF